MIPNKVVKTVKDHVPQFKQYRNIDKEQLYSEMENFFREEIIMNNLNREEFREKMKELYRNTY